MTRHYQFLIIFIYEPECFRCGKMFKNSRGVRIHQAKTKCLEKQQQRTARNSEAGEAEEVKGPESNHSAQGNQATDDGNEQRRDRINWPSSKEQEWSMLEEELAKILDNTLAGNVKEMIRSFVQVVYTRKDTE